MRRGGMVANDQVLAKVGVSIPSAQPGNVIKETKCLLQYKVN